MATEEKVDDTVTVTPVAPVVGAEVSGLRLTPEALAGHAETLRGISTEFQLRHISDTFCYQRVDGGKAPSATAVEPNESWFDIIQRSSKRIKAVTERNDTVTSPVIQPSPLLTW